MIFIRYKLLLADTQADTFPFVHKDAEPYTIFTSS